DGLVTQAQDITALQSGLTDAEGDISGQATAISTLQTRASEAEGSLLAQSIDALRVSKAVDVNAGADLEAILQGYENHELAQREIAYVTRESRAELNEAREALAQEL